MVVRVNDEQFIVMCHKTGKLCGKKSLKVSENATAWLPGSLCVGWFWASCSPKNRDHSVQKRDTVGGGLEKIGFGYLLCSARHRRRI